MTKKYYFLLPIICLFFTTFMIAQDKKTESKIDVLLKEMTLEEKVGQMNQYSGFFDATGPAPKDGDNKYKYDHIKSGKVGSMLNVRGAKQVRAMQKIAVEESRLGIPLIFGFDVIHGFKTISPIPLAESASWDLKAIEESARIAAIEASAAGLNWTFAPMMDISRDARWGRVMEGGGEDTYLGTQIAVARVKGFQGEDLSAANTIAACAKHFAGYGFVESGKEYNTVDVGLSTLYNVILPPFKAAKEAGIQTFMNSFSSLNGVPATGDPFLQRDILKGEWGFEGFVVSDWGSIGELKNHGFAEDDAHAALIAATAGSDMDMESHAYVDHLKNLVETGKVKMDYIDDAVRRILRVKFALGLFDDPYRYCDEEREKTLMNHADHHAAALDLAKKSIVLLKNEGNVLPLPKKGKKIALIGALADDKNSPLGNWRLASDNHTAVSVLEGMKAYDGNELNYSMGVKLNLEDPVFHLQLPINTTDKTGIEEAVAAAKEVDIVVMVLGENGFQSGEGRSRSSLQLPGLQQELLEAVHAVNPNIVLVLMNGRPLAVTWADENVPAIVEAWQLGSQTGHAVAEVLYGDYNPSGKLPMTFPRQVGQVPIYYNYKESGRSAAKNKGEVFWTHYNDETNDPLYAFGHGLSYTDFTYSDFKVAVNSDKKEVQVSVNVKNTGKMDGEEVVQLYIRDRVASVARPVKELKGFEKIALKAGESKMVEFTLTEQELGFYNNQGKFVVEAGDFDVMVGGSSETVLKDTFILK
ncbi:MAG: beta-glucosidase BglX [Chitinophagales bacterium]